MWSVYWCVDVDVEWKRQVREVEKRWFLTPPATSLLGPCRWKGSQHPDEATAGCFCPLVIAGWLFQLRNLFRSCIWIVGLGRKLLNWEDFNFLLEESSRNQIPIEFLNYGSRVVLKLLKPFGVLWGTRQNESNSIEENSFAFEDASYDNMLLGGCWRLRVNTWVIASSKSKLVSTLLVWKGHNFQLWYKI